MTSEIEIVNLSNFEKIQNFLNDSAYKEILENSENFNTRLCIERRLRLPFLDNHTGVAQSHRSGPLLFFKKRQRMPGFRDGQLYTYPASRWRKPKRQYLLNHHHGYRTYQYREHHHHQPHHSGSTLARDHYQTESASIAAADGNSMSASGDNDSKDSHANVEKEWFSEDLDISHYHHVDDFEEDFESDNDFDESYSSRGKRKRGSRSARKSTNLLEGTPKRGRKGGGSRRRTTGGDGELGDRRRRGGPNNSNSVAAAMNAAAVAAVTSTNNSAAIVSTNLEASNSNSASPIATNDESSQPALTLPTNPGTSTFDKTLTETSASNDATALAPPPATGAATAACPANGNGSNGAPLPPTQASGSNAAATASPKKTEPATGNSKGKMRPDREIAQPSPYCDFCLGDQRENKKTNLPEELVSCSDCGRSGHPSCLQFTPNMIISVKRYRWQCIECKYCSICGTSDNDDQLLFCDDCDRGYHMYCLSPPLITPPEGSWSCKLCMDEFHKSDAN